MAMSADLPRRLLVVDDDAALLQALPETLRLRMPETQVETAASAAAALARMGAADYDAVITDIKMPGMDGLGLLARIRELQPDTPTLIITGHGEHDLAVQALRLGAFDYLSKPLDRDYLIAALERAVHVRALRRQVAVQQQVLEHRALTLEQVVEGRTRELQRTADRLRVLTESAAAIHSARDVGEILRSVTDAARRLSDAAVALAGCRAAAEDPAGSRPLPWRVAASPAGHPELDERVVVDLLAPAASRGGTDPLPLPPGLAALLSWTLAVPMRSRDGSVHGAIMVGRREPPEAAEDLRMQVGALARQAAVALENAVLYQRERTVAETLQRSLLPGDLPEIPGLALDARYLPGQREAVGGDWYDVFALPSGQVGIAMGDVAGRGVWAAAVMGQLRNALRAFALDGDPPATVGARLNRFIADGAMATLLYLVFDPETMEARYINLGHLPPLLVTPDRSTRFLPGGAPPLGAKPRRPYQEESVQVARGSTLLLYTDGLIEARGVPIDHGLERLARTSAQYINGSIEGILEHLLAAVLQDADPPDDVAILALRVSGLDPERLALRLPAVPGSLMRLRHALRQWLAAIHVEPEAAHEIVTASSEACANAIEHAYGPRDATVSVVAECGGGRITVTVRDAGRWREPGRGRRGFGLAVMRALMETVDIQHGSGGTTVRMQRRIVAKVP
jgi:FixJ family two-component response regulator/anti-sigma regulatory factor (Ser/Thr protein kinase)